MILVILKKIIYFILIVCALVFLLYIVYVTIGTNVELYESSLVTSHNNFAADIFRSIADERAQENVVISPVSIQICLSFAFLGAESATAKQIRKALRIPINMSKVSFAEDFSYFLQKNFFNRQIISKDGPELHLANRIYVDESLRLKEQFNQLAKKIFKSEAVPMKFANGGEAVKAINEWVEERTNAKVKNLLQTDEVNGLVDAILLNVIYFKANWQIPFSESLTRKGHFKLSNERSVKVAMMYTNNENFKYAYLPVLDATALEMPYKNSDLSMLILLPNKIEGLQEMYKKLGKLDLRKINKKMEMEMVDVQLPKFHIEFDIDLKGSLRNLGMSSIFSDVADFSGLFAEGKLHKNINIKHKVILDVNEAGSEAIAATSIKLSFRSLNWGNKQFIADHPFMFLIRNQEVVYFSGHVARF